MMHHRVSRAYAMCLPKAEGERVARRLLVRLQSLPLRLLEVRLHP